jgi:hypothetical protein
MPINELTAERLGMLNAFREDAVGYIRLTLIH